MAFGPVPIVADFGAVGCEVGAELFGLEDAYGAVDAAWFCGEAAFGGKKVVEVCSVVGDGGV